LALVASPPAGIEPGVLQRARAVLPRGDLASAETMAARQRIVTWILWAHVAGLTAFGLVQGAPATHLLVEMGVLVSLIVVSGLAAILSPTVRATVSAIALMTCSALLVHLAEGSIEAHFHFFVMVTVIALYHHWAPFLVAIAYVALHHGVIGVLAPERVYDHAAAYASPVRWALIHAAFILAASAAQVAFWRIAEDEHDRATRSLEASERRFRAMIEHSLDAVAVLGPDFTIRYESASAEAVVGSAPSERRGTSVLDFLHPDDQPEAAAALAEVGEEPGGSAQQELRIWHARGEWRWFDVRVTNLVDDPDVGGIVVNYRDVTERRRLSDELAHQATHDPLTGLANRTLFLDRLGAALDGSEPIAVLFVDVDDFKMVNDALGHMAGDGLLREVGQRLSGAARPQDTCARVGGDEFAVLLAGPVTVAQARRVGEAMLAGLRRPITVEREDLTVSGSVGIVVSRGGDDATQVMRNADLAMYEAKRAGKGRCAVFEEGMLSSAIDRLALREDLHRALDGGELVNEYQPIFDLATGEVIGAEALIRWQHPTRGMLQPGAFIALAEERSDLIVPLGRGVLERACREAAAWPTDRPLTIHVNLSARQVTEPGLVATVDAALQMTGLPASRLTLEITESVLVEDPGRAAATLGALKELGVSLALDDFGTGFSSLSYLAAFPVDGLKVDKSFIDPLVGPDDGDHGAVVAAILDMATRLDLEVTAEGVEHRSQVDRLLALGCTRAQGFLLGRPRTAESLQALLTGAPDPSVVRHR
jgi:diguanylate cyclase (GGDEF)-like protein/PAS domain S-box-containing protein